MKKLIVYDLDGTLAESETLKQGEELMPSWTVEDFLGPELAKTSK